MVKVLLELGYGIEGGGGGAGMTPLLLRHGVGVNAVIESSMGGEIGVAQGGAGVSIERWRMSRRWGFTCADAGRVDRGGAMLRRYLREEDMRPCGLFYGDLLTEQDERGGEMSTIGSNGGWRGV